MTMTRLIVIGSSCGGVRALLQIVRELHADLPAAVLVVQHQPADVSSTLPLVLSRAGPLPARHPAQFELIQAGCIYVAPPDRHMLVTPGARIDLTRGPEENRVRPAIDATLRSAALNFGPAVVAVVLTGALCDGAAGAIAVKDHGGMVVVQDPEDAVAPSMPLSVLRHVRVNYKCGLKRMARLLNQIAHAPIAPPVEGPFTSLMQIENRIASGSMNPVLWSSVLAFSSPSQRTCALCGADMRELNDPRIRRLRCRAGHGSWVDVSEALQQTDFSRAARYRDAA
jgi:two-component system chemotaxis response regulator CheB